LQKIRTNIGLRVPQEAINPEHLYKQHYYQLISGIARILELEGSRFPQAPRRWGVGRGMPLGSWEGLCPLPR